MRSAYRDDPELAARAHRGLDEWLAAWDAGPPVLRGELVDGRLRITDTRRIAMEAEVLLSDEATALLLRLERPRPIDAIGARRGLGALLQRGFVVQHEGILLSVVVR